MGKRKSRGGVRGVTKGRSKSGKLSKSGKGAATIKKVETAEAGGRVRGVHKSMAARRSKC